MLKNYYTIPIVYLVLIFVCFLVQKLMPDMTELLAIFPRDPAHLPGTFTTVFLHANAEHLASNILPLAACLFGLFYFYGDIAFKVTLLCHIITGILIWIFACPAYHIGASGLVYALVFFILVSGFIRKNRRLMVLAFTILVFQSGLIWGIFPQGNQVSWESHLMGAIMGVSLAIMYRHQGPQADQPVAWEDEDTSDEDEYKNLTNRPD